MKTTHPVRAAAAVVLVLLAALNGCAKLSVQVDILDDAYRQTPRWRSADIRRALERIERETTPEGEGLPDPLDKRREATKARLASLPDEWRAALKALDDALAAMGQNGTYSQVAGTAFDDVPGMVDRAFARARQHYEEALRLGRLAHKHEPPSRERKVKKTFALLSKAETEIERGDNELRGLELAVEKRDNPVIQSVLDDANALAAPPAVAPTTAPAAPPGAAAAAGAATSNAAAAVADIPAKAAETVAKNIDSLIGEFGLFADPFASRIVHAPESYWRGIFNRAYGEGNFGNTDIAIKMQSMGDFTIKGVRVDATKVTQATFAGVGQAIKLAAAAYGVPVAGAFPTYGPAAKDGAGATTATTGGTSKQVGEGLLAADLTRKQVEAAERQRRQAALQMLKALGRTAAVLERTAPSPTDPERKAVIVQAKEAFSLTKAAMATPDPTGAAGSGAAGNP
jgi:hypothetical protein